MSSTVGLSPSNAQTLGKANWTMMVASQKAVKAQQRADKAAEAADASRKRAYDKMINVGSTKQLAASTRTSTKSFAAKDPAHALAALGCVDLDGELTVHDFSELGIIAYKYSVRTASKRMSRPPMDDQVALYPSARSSAMMAAKTVRYVYDLALQLATTQPEQYAEARRTLEWHSAQQVLNGRETRGAGIVMYSEKSLELVKVALAKAKERVGKRVEAGAQYETEMVATSDAATGMAVGDDAESI